MEVVFCEKKKELGWLFIIIKKAKAIYVKEKNPSRRVSSMERVLIVVPKATLITHDQRQGCFVKVFKELTWHAHVHRSNPSCPSGGTHNVNHIYIDIGNLGKAYMEIWTGPMCCVFF